MNYQKFIAFLLSLTLFGSLLAPAFFAQSGGNFTIERSVVAGGGGTISGGNFTSDGTIGQPVAGTTSVSGNFSVENGFWAGISQNSPNSRAPFDFDGDRKTDISIFRPAVGEWWYLESSDGGNAALQFGSSTDVPAPADYTGDGKADICFWRPATGEWFILRSENYSFFSFPFGQAGDIPAPADYDGDGKTDMAGFRPSTATWFHLNSGGSQFLSHGAAGLLRQRTAVEDHAHLDVTVPGGGQRLGYGGVGQAICLNQNLALGGGDFGHK